MKSDAPTDTQSGMTGAPSTIDFMVSSLLLCDIKASACMRVVFVCVHTVCVCN